MGTVGAGSPVAAVTPSPDAAWSSGTARGAETTGAAVATSATMAVTRGGRGVAAGAAGTARLSGRTVGTAAPAAAISRAGGIHAARAGGASTIAAGGCGTRPVGDDATTARVAAAAARGAAAMGDGPPPVAAVTAATRDPTARTATTGSADRVSDIGLNVAAIPAITGVAGDESAVPAGTTCTPGRIPGLADTATTGTTCAAVPGDQATAAARAATSAGDVLVFTETGRAPTTESTVA